jgi:hypothetical protein
LLILTTRLVNNAVAAGEMHFRSAVYPMKGVIDRIHRPAMPALVMVHQHRMFSSLRLVQQDFAGPRIEVVKGEIGKPLLCIDDELHKVA